MIRRLLNFTAVPSLLICLATVALWAWSRVTAGYWGFQDYISDGAPRWEVGIEAGEHLWFHWTKWSGTDDPDLNALPGRFRLSRSGNVHDANLLPPHGLGFSYEQEAGGGSMDSCIGFPYWFVFAMTAAPPVYWLHWNRPWRARRANECRMCFYNLTGNTSGVCPECGTPVARIAETQTRASIR